MQGRSCKFGKWSSFAGWKTKQSCCGENWFYSCSGALDSCIIISLSLSPSIHILQFALSSSMVFLTLTLSKIYYLGRDNKFTANTTIDSIVNLFSSCPSWFWIFILPLLAFLVLLNSPNSLCLTPPSHLPKKKKKSFCFLNCDILILIDPTSPWN